MNWRLLNLASSAYEQKPEPPSLCGLIYSGRRHLLSGLPEANKTLFALILGLELLRSSGDTFAMIDFESGPAATRLMLTELGATNGELERVLYPEIEEPPDATDIGMLVDAGATLAIIDTTPPTSTTTNVRTRRSSGSPGSTRSGSKASPPS